MEKKARIVFLVGGYYPTYSPPGLCAEKILSRLKDRFDVTVLTRWLGGQPENRRFCHDGVEIVQVNNPVNAMFFRTRSKVFRRILKYVSMVGGLLRCEGGFDWISRKMCGELEELKSAGPIQCVVSVGFPVHTHLAALRFRKRNPDVRWVTYSTDTYHKNKSLNRLLAGFRERRELKCYAKADRIFFSREIFETCASFFGPSVMAKSELLDYVVDFGIGSSVGKPVRRPFPEGEIALVFGGAFVDGVRSPEYVLQVLECLPEHSKIRWHVYSDTGFREILEAVAERLPNRVVLHDPIPISAFRETMRGCDVLVNVSNDSDQFFPSKVFEYIATGRPIVDFRYPGRKANPVFERHPDFLGLEAGGDPRRDAKRLEEFCAVKAGVCRSPEFLSKVYESHLPEQAFQSILSFIEKGV